MLPSNESTEGSENRIGTVRIMGNAVILDRQNHLIEISWENTKHRERGSAGVGGEKSIENKMIAIFLVSAHQCFVHTVQFVPFRLPFAVRA